MQTALRQQLLLRQLLQQEHLELLSWREAPERQPPVDQQRLRHEQQARQAPQRRDGEQQAKGRTCSTASTASTSSIASLASQEPLPWATTSHQKQWPSIVEAIEPLLKSGLPARVTFGRQLAKQNRFGEVSAGLSRARLSTTLQEEEREKHDGKWPSSVSSLETSEGTSPMLEPTSEDCLEEACGRAAVGMVSYSDIFPHLTVRNTFLTVDEPEATSRCRSKTWGYGLHPGGLSLGDGSQESEAESDW